MSDKLNPVSEWKVKGPYFADKQCFDLAIELRGLMARIMESSKRDTLSLAQKAAIKDVAHILDAQSRKLFAVEE